MEEKMPDGNFSDTKEKILHDTNQLVISLNTQVAVLTTSNNALKGKVEDYMERLERKMDKLDEKDATLDSRVTVLRNDHTELKGRVASLESNMQEVKNDQSVVKWVNFVITSIVSAIAASIAYVLGQR